MAVIDLRSDTVTRPSASMRAAMANAEVGDDVYGEDPTVNALQRFVAELTGHEEALFVTSGTQGNLVSLLTHCARGDAAILGQDSHIYYYEAGGLAVLGGILPLLVDDATGLPSAPAVAAACRAPDVHVAPARLLCLENTHNRCGGIAVPGAEFGEAVAGARRLGLRVHLDGARVFNAAAKWAVDVRTYTELVDSVQICLSKGLGAPAGSLICGSRAFIDEARHWRKRVGGGMRQTGILAAAGLVALRDMRSRLAEDHENAEVCADLLGRAGLCVEEAAWRTNMVFLVLDAAKLTASDLAARCAQRAVLVAGMGPARVRIVTHADVSRADVAAAVQVIVEEACR